MIITNFFHSRFQTIATRTIGGILHAKYQFDVENLPEIDSDKTHLFVINHQNRLDAFAAMTPFSTKQKYAIARPTIRIMTAASIYYSFLRPFLWACGCFPTRKRTGTYSAVDESVKYLRGGNSVMIFPEGKRVTQAESKPRDGVERIIRGYGKDLVVILVHIEWSKQKIRSRIRIRYSIGNQADDVETMMEKIYQL